MSTTSDPEVYCIEAARLTGLLLYRDPQVFSCVLEYLYKGDYYPRLVFNKRHASFQLEDQDPSNLGGRGCVESTVDIPGAGGALLKDTVVYCAAERYGLDELKRLALRKQGLQSGIAVDVILRSARFAYENTPDSDSKLRAHYLALIIRSRKTFKRSGTMQMEMEIGGSKLYVRAVGNIIVNTNRSGFSIYSLQCATMWMTLWILATTDLPRQSKACSAHLNN